MKYMNKEIKYLNNTETKYTYITPHDIYTTNKTISKKINHKNQT